jgi:hypothetical protein
MKQYSPDRAVRKMPVLIIRSGALYKEKGLGAGRWMNQARLLQEAKKVMMGF